MTDEIIKVDCQGEGPEFVERAEIARLNEQLTEARERLAVATKFTLQRRGRYAGEPTETIMVEWRDEDRWAVTNGHEVLNADGAWEYEPFPSNRTDEFKDRTRFSLDEAFARARAFLKGETDNG